MSLTLVVIVLSLVFSAFFSGMEVAFLKANKLRVELDRKHGRTYAGIVDIFIKHSGQFISTLLVGNCVALVVYSIFATRMVEPFLMQYTSSVVAIFLVTILIAAGVFLMAGELIPKRLFRLNPNLLLRIFVAPLALAFVVLYPVSKFTSWISTLMLRMVGLRVKRDDTVPIFDTVDLVKLINESEKGHVEHTHDLKIFQNALDFYGVKVRDRMIPRTDIKAIEDNASIEELKQVFIDSNFSRIPVYKGTIDNIVGYVNSKELFKKPRSIRQMLLPISFIPETVSAQKMLARFIKEQKSIAIVVDEFGGTAGLVTIEDIIEEIFGDIEDEHDEKDTVEKRLKDGTYLFSGKLKVDALNERYGLEIPESDEYDTLAGFILYSNANIPSPSDLIVFGNFKFKILRMSSTRIILVHLSVQE
ncbi:hemolysin family protein [uncultured Acetobacteroides sp.]|uniref:hemolysin family protein n=1 Tax=uncultured Acetobacteroides sp. TaxID=1760811 RepID=UPI0029F49F98|nr:hemolysin family protein [uncultured Acetobacteroides sp.]